MHLCQPQGSQESPNSQHRSHSLLRLSSPFKNGRKRTLLQDLEAVRVNRRAPDVIVKGREYNEDGVVGANEVRSWERAREECLCRRRIQHDQTDRQSKCHARSSGPFPGRARRPLTGTRC